MEQVKVDVLYTNGLEKSYESTVDSLQELSDFLELIANIYNGANAGYIRLPNKKEDEVIFIDLKNTMSVSVYKKGLFDE